jgi:glycosyltransferase involved in cell wall biosynthesis
MGKVSIILPAYNSKRFILQTVNSVLAQDWRDFELLVIDDGSTDGTANIVQGLDERIKVIRQENKGIAGARNVGIDAATGDFIALLDHDDLWHPEKLSAQLKCFALHPKAGCVYSTFIRWVDETPPIFPVEHLDPANIDPEFSGWIYHKLLITNSVFLSSAMFRREVMREIGYFDPALPPADDWDFNIRVSRKYSFSQLRQTTALYRVHNGQTSRIVSPIDLENNFRNRVIAQYGLAGPDGAMLSKAELREAYYNAHINFANQHYRRSDPSIALSAYWGAIKRKPWALTPYVYGAASALKAIFGVRGNPS